MEPPKSYQKRATSKQLAASKVLPVSSWILGLPGYLLPAFLDNEGRQSLRLTCKQLRDDVGAYTRCLTLGFPKEEEKLCSEEEKEKAQLVLSDHRILYKCCKLERLVILIQNHQEVVLVDGLPDKLQALTVMSPLRGDPAVFLGPLLCIQSLKELNLTGIQHLSQVTDLAVMFMAESRNANTIRSIGTIES
eukprot:gene27096-2320_t